MTLQTERVEIPLPDGSRMAGYLARPEGDEARPGVIVWMEIFGVNALLGLQCRLLDNLGIFGEVGLGYSSASYEHENTTEATRNTSRWGLTNSGIGLIFYF